MSRGLRRQACHVFPLKLPRQPQNVFRRRSPPMEEDESDPRLINRQPVSKYRLPRVWIVLHGVGHWRDLGFLMRQREPGKRV